MQVCFTCGAANPPGAAQCEGCGADLPAGQGAAPPPPPVEEPAAVDNSCPFCGQTVEPDAVECPHCRLSLDAKDPLNAPAPRGHADNMTGRYEEFQRKVEGLRMGTTTPEAFIDWLADIRVKLASKRDGYIDTVQKMGYYDTHPQEVDIAVEGITAFGEAVEEMWDFTLGQTDISGLDSALAAMWQANEKINEAMRMNRGFRAQLEDDWGYM
jgi:hypothetical protein